ncbi:MAG: GNAT family N-acetyltransferase [Hungatella sp.]|nr:GNAT family N-acetyltransferase [Hungatella sp.]
MVFELTQPQKAAALFEDWQESLIWSCLQGVMGRICADSRETPASAAALLGDFCFFAGKPDREMVMYVRTVCRQDFIILVPEDRGWAEIIESCCGKHAKKVLRYAIKKEPHVFDREKLQAMTGRLPQGYVLTMIDQRLFWHCRETAWCRDWVSQYEDYQSFQRYGLGAVILKDGEPVSGASSYSSYLGGIEVEIDTREDHRRKGLAGICGAKLILECLKRGWYPSWDAQNLWSVALAEKLGYHFDHEYEAYEVNLREAPVL